MKKNNPKMIINLSFESDELDEKIRAAMEKYAERLMRKDLDDVIAKYVNKRIDKLLHGKSWSGDKKIEGMNFDDYVKSKTEQALTDAIDKNAKEILAKKLAALI